MKRFSSLLTLIIVLGSYSFCIGIKVPGNSPIKASVYYSVKSNGKPLFVYDSPVGSYVFIDIDGKTELSVRAAFDLKWVDVRPRQAGINPEWKDSIYTLTIDKPCNLSVELNGDPLNHPLFIFANSPETFFPDTTNPSVIYFGPGRIYKPGIIKPKSGQLIYIAEGAIVEGEIEAVNVENVSIRGRGILVGGKHTYADNKWHKMITFRDSKNLTIKDICIIDSYLWQIVPINSEKILIDNVKILSDNGSDDGIDICRSRNIIVKNSFIRTKDDCIAIKGNFEYPDSVITSNIDIYDCVFWNAAWGNGIDIGFELQCAEVKNIHVKNCDFIHVDKGATISIHNGDKAKVSKLLFEDIRVEDSNQKLFDLAIFYNQYAIDKPSSKEESEKIYLRGAWDGVLYLDKKQKKEHAKFRGSIENVTFRNITITDGIFPFSLFCGYDENHMVKNILIENLIVHGKKIMSLKDARIYSEFAEGILIK